MADLHWKTIGYIEAGKRDFGSSTLARLALCLGVSGSQLLEGILDETGQRGRLQAIARATARKRKAKSAN